MTRTSLFAAALGLSFAATPLMAQPPAAPPAGMQGHTMSQGMMMGEVVARAKADIKGEGITGTAEFIEHKAANADKLQAGAWTGNAVEVIVDVKGLKPGLHGMHLHAIGKCEPDFGAAGGHFDPGPNSNTDPDANHPFHMGDLPNLFADAQGHAAARAWTSRVSLTAGPLSVFDADGTAIIVHANPDQGITGDPKSGVAGGPRVACGVLVKQ